MPAVTVAAAEGPEQAGGAQVEDASHAAAAVAALLQRVQDAAAAARREGRLAEAVRLCTDALEAAQSAACGARVVSDVLAERSAAHAALRDSERALKDAQAAVYAHASEQSLFCLGQALSAMQRHADAERAYAAALRLDEASDRLRGVLEAACAPAAAELIAVKAEARAAEHSRRLCLTFRQLRERELRDAVLSQWRQTMTAPDWDVEDYAWRPTFLPRMREQRLEPASLQKASTRFFAAYAERVAVLDQPKRALRVLRNHERMAMMQSAAESVCKGATVAVFETGTGVLPLLCAAAGAVSVTAFERSDMLAHVALQTLEANADAPGAEAVSIKVASQALHAGRHGAMQPADVVLTDLFDHTLLGMRVIPRLRDAVACGAVAPDARVVPAVARVHAVLVEMRLDRVRGFDLTPMNAYRWHPVAEAVQLAREPHRLLSAPFQVCDVNFQAAAQTAASEAPEDDALLNVRATADGVWNAVAMWFDLDLLGDGTLCPESTDRVTPHAVYYLDECRVQRDEEVQLRVRRDDTRFTFTSSPPQWRPRHAWIPTWHNDMLNDDSRNAAYERAIVRTVAAKRAAKAEVMVLDIGAGSGLLSMMAARAGAHSVVAVELSGHMCDVAEQVISCNGLSSKVVVLQRDSRRMFAATSEGLRAGRKPDGEAPELVRQADVLVFEVFDSGLIGEGALHLTALAQHRLLLPDATVIPASARVFCQPIQFRHQRCCGVDVQLLNQYNWRADYDGVELAAVQEQWCELAGPVQIFEFNFANAAAHAAPAAVVQNVRATGAGVVNALAVWFELQLDEHEVLTTSPHSTGKGATWQNAVMFVPEMRVATGDELRIEASHDTYSISATARHAAGDSAAMSTGVPLCDPVWRKAHDTMAGANAQIMKSIVQSPIEHRHAAIAATLLGSRPGDVGLEADAAAAFCTRMFC